MISQITPDGIESGQPRDVDGRLGVAGADQHAAFARDERKDMSGGDDVVALPLGPESIATATVRARSAAEIPVVTPSRASIETVNAVSWRVPLARLIKPEAQARRHGRLVRARQISPRPWRAMKLIFVGRRHLRGDDQIALILAVLIVDEDEHPPVLRLIDDLLGRRQESRGADA